MAFPETTALDAGVLTFSVAGAAEVRAYFDDASRKADVAALGELGRVVDGHGNLLDRDRSARVADATGAFADDVLAAVGRWLVVPVAVLALGVVGWMATRSALIPRELRRGWVIIRGAAMPPRTVDELAGHRACDRSRVGLPRLTGFTPPTGAGGILGGQQAQARRRRR